jgi:site-specific DNA recombinase
VKRKPYLYRGMFRCGECGCFITTETQKGHNYLRCTKRVKKNCSQPYVRETHVNEQIDEFIRGVAVPAHWIEWMLEQVQAKRSADADRLEQERIAVADVQRHIELKLDRLLAAHLDGDISQDEYRTAKARLLADKQATTLKATSLTGDLHKRFEPVTRFLNSLQQATLLSSSDDTVAKRDFLKNNGSNPTLRNRRMHWQARGAWKTVGNHGPFAHHTTAPRLLGAVSAGETCPMFSKAEREGFEPSNGFKPITAFPVLLLRPLGHLSGTRRGGAGEEL